MKKAQDLNTVLSTLLNTFEYISTEMKQYAAPLFDDYSLTEMHCIEHIGKLQDMNVTKLSKSLNMTRGGISKLIKKLLQKQAIIAYHKTNNQKEIYYKLTDIGQDIFAAHEKIHQEWNSQDLKFFKQCKDDEVKIAIKFINQYTQHLKQILKEEKKCKSTKSEMQH